MGLEDAARQQELEAQLLERQRRYTGGPPASSTGPGNAHPHPNLHPAHSGARGAGEAGGGAGVPGSREAPGERGEAGGRAAGTPGQIHSGAGGRLERAGSLPGDSGSGLGSGGGGAGVPPGLSSKPSNVITYLHLFESKCFSVCPAPACLPSKTQPGQALSVSLWCSSWCCAEAEESASLGRLSPVGLPLLPGEEAGVVPHQCLIHHIHTQRPSPLPCCWMPVRSCADWDIIHLFSLLLGARLVLCRLGYSVCRGQHAFRFTITRA